MSREWQTSPQQNAQYDAVLDGQSPGTSAPPFDENQLTELFTGLMRVDRVFDRALGVIKDSHFRTSTEGHYKLLWQVLKRCRQEFGRPTRDMVLVEVYREINNGLRLTIPPELIDVLIREDDAGIICGGFAATDISVPYMMELLRRFAFDREVVTPLRAKMNSVAPYETPEGLGDMLDNLQDVRSRLLIGDELPMVEAVPSLDSQLNPPLSFVKTGLDWIDGSIRGLLVGEVTGLIGPTGGGKTTLATHIAVQRAMTEFAAANLERREPGLTLLFTYEETPEKIWPRLWSCAMSIERTKLETMSNPATELTTRENMSPYEHHIQDQGGGEGLCEQERWELGRTRLNKTLKLFNMAGSHPYPNAGNGFVPEIAQIVEAVQQQEGRPVDVVLVDWAGECCRRWIAAQGLDSSQYMRTKLSDFGADVRRLVSERFGCASVVVHQLAGADTNRNPTALMHHNQSQDSKTFANHMAVCGCLGSPDKSNGIRLLNWSKTRHAPAETVHPVLLRINDHFARLDDMSQAFCRDENSRKFISVEERDRVQGAPEPRPQQQPAGPRPLDDIRRDLYEAQQGGRQ